MQHHETSLIGHKQAQTEVVQAFASGRMHHAWLITGPEGIGKHRLALHIANHVLSNAQNPIDYWDASNRVTKLIQAESHPDMFILRRAIDEKTGAQRQVIVVDDTLKVSSFLRKTATHGGWRVVIVDEAHTLNRFSQNAILKILEEPPAHTLILMTVTTPGILLPTIRSRCRLLSLAPLDDQAMRMILSRAAPELEPGDADSLIKLADGSVGFALKILQTDALPLYRDMVEMLGKLPKLDLGRLHKFADMMGRKADFETYQVLSNLLLRHIRQHILALSHTGHSVEVNRQFDMYEKVKGTLNLADQANLDHKLAFIKAISDIRAALS
ncbi:MAG: DNA polymerase III subunit delta' [Alphaproteobacteria bacterium]|nr:DNA polymerase III subunit delta' [Alphaproteobacteria bacterium]MBV8549424.1 DNA polymerase III subunit delta' [Alphaproteobacteria bacterium]